MVKLVSEIAGKIGRLDRYQSLDVKPCLRRNNRIRSIHSSLAIEANSLSFDAVRGVIDGKTVIGTPELKVTATISGTAQEISEYGCLYFFNQNDGNAYRTEGGTDGLTIESFGTYVWTEALPDDEYIEFDD